MELYRLDLIRPYELIMTYPEINGCQVIKVEKTGLSCLSKETSPRKDLNYKFSLLSSLPTCHDLIW